MVAVNGDAMPAFAGRPLGRELLPDPRGRPVPRVRPETAEQVADHGVEWARHFQRCSVAGWESDLMICWSRCARSSCAGESGKAEPDGEEVRSRWAKLAPLAKALGAAASEGTIGALVENLF